MKITVKVLKPRKGFIVQVRARKAGKHIRSERKIARELKHFQE